MKEANICNTYMAIYFHFIGIENGLFFSSGFLEQIIKSKD